VEWSHLNNEITFRNGWLSRFDDAAAPSRFSGAGPRCREKSLAKGAPPGISTLRGRFGSPGCSNAAGRLPSRLGLLNGAFGLPVGPRELNYAALASPPLIDPPVLFVSVFFAGATCSAINGAEERRTDQNAGPQECDRAERIEQNSHTQLPPGMFRTVNSPIIPPCNRRREGGQCAGNGRRGTRTVHRANAAPIGTPGRQRRFLVATCFRRWNRLSQPRPRSSWRRSARLR
jgi:hypothetical protein